MGISMQRSPWFISGSSSHPGFLATLPRHTCNFPRTGALIFSKTLYDVGNNYNNKTGQYRVPLTGRYIVSVRIHAAKNHATFKLIVNGKERIWAAERDNSDSDKQVISQAVIILQFNQNDLIYVDPVPSSGETLYGSVHNPPSPRSWFSVTLLTTNV